MSRGAPLACFHPQASHSFADNARRLAPACSAMNCRRKTISSALISRPRYLHRVGMAVVWQSGIWNARPHRDFFYVPTLRHTGAAAASGSPAANSNCAW